MKIRLRTIHMYIIFFVLVLLVSGCFLKTLFPAPKRPFTSNELLVNKEELPLDWTIPSGPQKDTDNSRPPGSMQIDLYKVPKSAKPDITERVSIYSSVEQAKTHFSEQVDFPENTEIQGWSFVSVKTDEQKFSCYTYSNLDYPICTWLARYQEITIEIIGRLLPGRATLNEMQAIVKVVDDKVTNYLLITPTKP